MILAGLMGSLGAVSQPRTVTWSGIEYTTVLEGQQNTVYLNFENWDGTTVYWFLTDGSSQIGGGQVSANSGTISPGTGNSSRDFSFTFTADSATDGPLSYYVRIELGSGQLLVPQQGPYTCVDSSQESSIVFQLDTTDDPALNNNTWADDSGQSRPATIYNLASVSSDFGGVYEFNNGSSTYATVPSLQASTYGALTLAAWIKPTVVTGITQTIIAKELAYKLRINGDGTVTFSSGKGTGSWEVTATVSAGVVTASQWHHVVATSDSSYTRIYINGIKITETNGNIIGANNAVFDIGAYSSDGNATQGDFFDGYMGEVKMWNYALDNTAVIYQYNTKASQYGLEVVPTSMAFNGTSSWMLVSNDQTDWNLGDTYTIEYWSYTNAYSQSGSPRIVMSQGGGGDKIDVGYTNTKYLFNNTEPQIEEPSPNSWNHVAWVSYDGGNPQLFVNGVEIATINPMSLTDGSTDLVIGRRGASDSQYFDGNLTNLRVSTAARYSTTFVPSISMTSNTDDKLMLAGQHPFGITVDVADSPAHPITNNGGVISTNFPRLQSMNFVPANQSHVYAAPSNAWNLGTTWTIEFWIKANASSTTASGGIWGLFNQGGWSTTNSVNIALNNGYLSVGQGGVNDNVTYFEPYVGGEALTVSAITDSSGDWSLVNGSGLVGTGGTGAGIIVNVSFDGLGVVTGVSITSGGTGYTTGDVITVNSGGATATFTITAEIIEPTWTHVAVVNDAGTQTVYYNGVAQSVLAGAYDTANYTNTTDNLYIGRIADPGTGYFNGKMANVRISNAAKYSTGFTPSIDYYVEADTKLFLGNYNTFYDVTAARRVVSTSSILSSTDFPSP
jgi:hypothetical protein